MANIIIKGYKAFARLMTKGYYGLSGASSIKICKVYTEKYIHQRVYTEG